MIECEECESDRARVVRVTYTTGFTETLELCNGCEAEFANGSLVTDVIRTTRGEQRRRH